MALSTLQSWAELMLLALLVYTLIYLARAAVRRSAKHSDLFGPQPATREEQADGRD